MKTLVTGAAGFIGHALVTRLLADENDVVGVDNLNDYYDVGLKVARLRTLGIQGEIRSPQSRQAASGRAGFTFYRADIDNESDVERIFADHQFDTVINLAAQAGVRYSLINPRAYIDTNINGFFNILDNSRKNNVKHFIFASSSSVYGLNRKQPFSEHDGTDHPVSLYAATKKSNEMIAHTYAHLYGLPSTGLRFFTVYGPWSRPDMAAHLFASAILAGRSIDVFNHGKLRRDFTFIDDIIEGVMRVISSPPEPNPGWDSIESDIPTSSAPYRIFNIGSQRPIDLMYFISLIEKNLNMEAKKNFLPMQQGDVYETFADVSDLHAAFGFEAGTSVEEGVEKFVGWFKEYYRIPRG